MSHVYPRLISFHLFWMDTRADQRAALTVCRRNGGRGEGDRLKVLSSLHFLGSFISHDRRLHVTWLVDGHGWSEGVLQAIEEI
jgi:hypothetical protein